MHFYADNVVLDERASSLLLVLFYEASVLQDASFGFCPGFGARRMVRKTLKLIRLDAKR